MARRRRTSSKQRAAARRNIKKAHKANRKGRRRPARSRPTKARRGRARSRKSYGRARRNPAITLKAYTSSLKGLPKNLPKLMKGNVIRNAGFAAGGIVTGLVGGSFLQRYTLPLLEKLPFVGGNLSGGMVQRVLGAAFASVASFGVGQVAIKKDADRTAFITGGVAGALVEMVFPGRLGAQLAKIPVIGPYIGYSSPVMGLAAYYGSNELAAYVESPAYQGVGAYVESPAYQGVGAYVESPAYQGVGEYVEAPGYQSASAAGDTVLSGLGVEMDYGRNDLAGIGSNMASFLDDPVY